MFKKEVSETFLRCVKMGYEQDLAVIELNGLKIAEDRTFADCARHVFASILDLCLPHPTNCKAEYQSLFQQTAPDTDTQVASCCHLSARHMLDCHTVYHLLTCGSLCVAPACQKGHWSLFSMHFLMPANAWPVCHVTGADPSLNHRKCMWWCVP